MDADYASSALKIYNATLHIYLYSHSMMFCWYHATATARNKHIFDALCSCRPSYRTAFRLPFIPLGAVASCSHIPANPPGLNLYWKRNVYWFETPRFSWGIFALHSYTWRAKGHQISLSGQMENSSRLLVESRHRSTATVSTTTPKPHPALLRRSQERSDRVTTLKVVPYTDPFPF